MSKIKVKNNPFEPGLVYERIEIETFQNEYYWVHAQILEDYTDFVKISHASDENYDTATLAESWVRKSKIIVLRIASKREIREYFNWLDEINAKKEVGL